MTLPPTKEHLSKGLQIFPMSVYSSTQKSGGVTLQRQAGILSRQEKYLGIFFLLLALGLRIIYILRYRFDSDEPQHLHVAWAWAHGLMQYRDVFDNHMPLFHLLCAPLVALLGNRPDLLILMRLAMLPLWGATLWGTYRLGRILWGQRLGWWAAVLAGLMPICFTSSLEFREDDLWALLWVLFVVILLSGRIRVLRSFWAGGMMGAAFGVSMKSCLLLVSLALAGLATATLCSENLYKPGWLRRLAANLGAGSMGGILIPAAIVSWFYFEGAFTPFYYGVVQHNMFPGLGRLSIVWLRWLFVPVLIIIWLAARTLITRWETGGPQTGKRVFVLLTLAIYLAALETLWPLVTWQDFIPMVPLIAVLLAALLDQGPLHQLLVVSNRRGGHSTSACAFFISAAICFVIWLGANIPRKNMTAGNIQTWKAVLNLTNPHDYVMDLKGELIFRRRAVYYVFESITKARIAKGLIDPQVTKRLAETRTCVVDNVPKDDLSFLKSNYLSVGPLFVAGKILAQKTADVMRPLSFTVVIPARYRIVTPFGPASGKLDGIPYHGSSFLSPGKHEFQPFHSRGTIALVWAKAVEKGFSPFRTNGEMP